MPKPTISKKESIPNNTLINEFEFRYWSTFIFVSFINISIGWIIVSNFSNVSDFFNSLKLSSLPISEFISKNIWAVLTAGGLYFFSLAFWKFKKGKFTESEYKVRFWSGILIYRVFNIALLLPFLVYLLLSVFTDQFKFLWIGIFLVCYTVFLIYFSLPTGSNEKSLSKRWFRILLLICGISWLIACFNIKGLWEPFLITFISCIISPVSNALLLSYIQSLEDYNSIKIVHSKNEDYMKASKDGTLGKKIIDFFIKIDDSKENSLTFLFIFETLESLGNMILVGAFGLVVLAWVYDFNAISTIYIHIALIISALQLWTIGSKFPMVVDIRVDKRWLKGVFLLERSDDKVLIMDTDGKRLFNSSDVSEIYVPKKLR